VLQPLHAAHISLLHQAQDAQKVAEDVSNGAGGDGVDFFMAGTKVSLTLGIMCLILRVLSVLMNRAVGSHHVRPLASVDVIAAAGSAAGSGPCIPKHV
jgi:hypothetical protein